MVLTGTASALVLSGCVSVPSYEAIQQLPVNRTAIVQSPMDCLYEKAVEKITSEVWLNEPKPDAFINEKQGYAWIRQPLTLLMMKPLSADVTKITRQQTSTANLFGQGTELMDFLAANPCRTK